MRYYKLIKDGYIAQIGIDCGGDEITEVEYLNILGVIQNMPEPQPGYTYRLTTGLTWELVELPPQPDEISDSDALAILLGGDV